MNDSYLDGLLDELVRVDARESWDDVLRRARRAQRRYVAVVVAISVLVLAPTTWAAYRAFEGSPAPPKIQRTFQFVFERMNATAGPESPHVIANKAHGVVQVRTRYAGPLDLWAAPTTEGGSCFWVAWERHMVFVRTSVGTGACVRKHPKPGIGVGANQQDLPRGGPGRYVEIYGYASGSEVSARVKLTDGRSLRLPVVEHYFLGVAPHGVSVESVTGLDAKGKVIARSTTP